MIYIGGLDLRNVVTFADVSVDFKNTVTWVRGVNLDSDPVNPTSNGVGKTLLFSALSNIRYQATPTAIKKRSKRDILGSKNSSIGFVLKPYADAPTYEIIQTPSAYKIYEDETDLQIRTAPLAEAKIAQLFPLEEIDYYTYCYISTIRPYLLQTDTDSNRLQHFTDIFRLDQYSEIKKYFSIKSREITDNEIRVSTLEQSRITLQRKIKAHKENEVDAKAYKVAKAEFDKITKQLSDKLAEKNVIIRKEEALQSLLEIEHKLDVLRAKYDHEEHPIEFLKSLTRMRKGARAWNEYSLANTQYQRSIKTLKEKLDALEVPATSLKDIKALLLGLTEESEQLDAQIALVESKKKKYEQAQEEVSELEQSLEEHSKIKDKVDLEYDYSEDISACTVTLRLEKLLKHDHEDKTCPTCMSEVDFDQVRATVASAKKRLPKLEAYEECKQLLLKLSVAAEQLAKFKFKDNLAELKKKLKAVDSKKEQLEEDRQTHSKIASIKDQLDSIEKPEKPSVAKPSLSVDEIDTCIDLCRDIEKNLAAKEKLLENSKDLQEYRSAAEVVAAIKSFTKAQNKLDDQLAALNERQAEYATTVSNYSSYTNVLEVYEKELKDVTAKIEELKPTLAQKKILTILEKAYGTKGLRSKAADEVCALYESNLNHYRDIIFAEPFIFTVNASEKGISIIVDRNNGKANSKSDVRHLSGAESNSFRLLSLLSILPLIPDSRRVNYVVLDEPTAHMCPIYTNIFLERFVPVLRELVPSVFIITPKKYESCPNSVEWLIEKKHGVSRLIENAHA